MTVRILTVGDKPAPEIAQLIADYEKRLPRSIKIIWELIPSGKSDPKTSMRLEAESLLKKIDQKDHVILLDETGKQLTSPELSNKLFREPRDLSIIIGGAYGVDDSIKNRADYTWSLSKLVFPHQIVKLILAEQLYRAAMIHSNHPYHHS